MLDVLKLIFKCMLMFINKLFTIDVGFTNLGTVLCIVYILLPMLLVIVNFFRSNLVSELDERYDESRPIETWTSVENQWLRSPGSTRDYGRVFRTNHTRTRKRRYRL